MYEHKTGIKFRKVTPDDWHNLFQLKSESWWGTHTTPIMNANEQKEWILNLDDRETLVMIAEAPFKIGSSHPWGHVGVCIYSNFDWVARTCNISGSIYKAFRGTDDVKGAFHCGLDFCFEMLNMYRVQAEVLDYHVAAQKLEIDDLGFKVEGRRRHAAYKSGEYYDSIMLGILRHEWMENAEGRNCIVSVDGWKQTPSCNKNIDHEKFNKDATQAKKDLGLVSP